MPQNPNGRENPLGSSKRKRAALDGMDGCSALASSNTNVCPVERELLAVIVVRMTDERSRPTRIGRAKRARPRPTQTVAGRAIATPRPGFEDRSRAPLRVIVDWPKKNSLGKRTRTRIGARLSARLAIRDMHGPIGT